MTTLLLNGDYTPLKVISRPKAIRLVVNDKVTMVETGDRFIRAGNLSIPEPKVVALHKYIHVPRKENTVSRRAVLFRDKNTCVYCGGHATTIDHIIPRSKGGKHDWSNVVAACKPCNSKKSDSFLESLGWEIHKQPKMPSGSFWVLIRAKEIDPTWEAFLDTKW